MSVLNSIYVDLSDPIQRMYQSEVRINMYSLDLVGHGKHTLHLSQLKSVACRLDQGITIIVKGHTGKNT